MASTIVEENPGKFIDLFQWLPNAIATSLIQLESSVNGPDDPREEAAFLDTMRTLTAGAAHHFFEQSTHPRATTIISQLWNTRGAFTLYLRAFHLGSKVVGPIPALPGSLFNASEEVLTIARPEDRTFQEMLAAAVEHLMPVLGIENPDNPVRTEKLPKLTVAQDEWQETVVRLIQAARVVVVYTDRPTAGVAAELKLIVNEGRAADTLLVQEADETELLWRGSPSEAAFDKFVKQPGAQISGAWSQWLERFPTVLNWSSSNPDPKAFAEAIEAITSRSGEGHFSGGAPIPRSVVPIGPDAVRANEEMMELFKHAQLHIGAGEYRTAERRLYRALVRSFVVDAVRMRASVFLELGRVQAFHLQRLGHGKENCERALELWDRLGILPMKATTLQEIAVIEDMAGKPEAAERYARESLAVPLAERDYWGEFCCWNVLYGVAWKQKNGDDAATARLNALRAYHEFRTRGGIPPRPATRCLAAFLGFVTAEVRSGTEPNLSRYRSWLQENQTALQCGVADGMISAVHDFTTKRLSEDELLGMGEGLDQGWELLRFVTSLQ
jgi:hypothetical protein